jgi:hypothetical protein
MPALDFDSGHSQPPPPSPLIVNKFNTFNSANRCRSARKVQQNDYRGGVAGLRECQGAE